MGFIDWISINYDISSLMIDGSPFTLRYWMIKQEIFHENMLCIISPFSPCICRIFFHKEQAMIINVTCSSLLFLSKMKPWRFCSSIKILFYGFLICSNFNQIKKITYSQVLFSFLFSGAEITRFFQQISGSYIQFSKV